MAGCVGRDALQLGDEQLGQTDAEGLADGDQCPDGAVGAPGLDAAQVRALDVAAVGQLLHGQIALFPVALDPARNRFNFFLITHKIPPP